MLAACTRHWLPEHRWDEGTHLFPAAASQREGLGLQLCNGPQQSKGLILSEGDVGIVV